MYSLPIVLLTRRSLLKMTETCGLFEGGWILVVDPIGDGASAVMCPSAFSTLLDKSTIARNVKSCWKIRSVGVV